MPNPPLLCICGIKNSGKTTLLQGLLPLLTARGLRVAVLKHDGHDFAPDVPGTDSHRALAAGAYGVAVYSSHRYMVTRGWEQPDLSPLLAQFADADLILMEGGKHTDYPKIELVRAAVSPAPACPPHTLLALCTDVPGDWAPLPVFAPDDHAALAAFIYEWLATRG